MEKRGWGQLEVRGTKHGCCLAGGALKDKYVKMYSCASNIIFMKIEYNTMWFFFVCIFQIKYFWNTFSFWLLVACFGWRPGSLVEKQRRKANSSKPSWNVEYSAFGLHKISLSCRYHGMNMCNVNISKTMIKGSLSQFNSVLLFNFNNIILSFYCFSCYKIK